MISSLGSLNKSALIVIFPDYGTVLLKENYSDIELLFMLISDIYDSWEQESELFEPDQPLLVGLDPRGFLRIFTIPFYY